MKKVSKSRVLFVCFKVLLYAVSVVLGVLLMLGVQDLCANDSPVFAIIGVVMLGAVVVVAIVNHILTAKLVKKYNSVKNYGELFDETNDKFERAKNDYQAAEKAVIKRKNTIIACRMILFTWLIAIMVISGVATKETNPCQDLAIVVATIGCLSYALPLLELIVYSEPPMTPDYELNSKDYPLLFEVVERAKQTLQCSKPFKMYAVVGNGISVSSSLNGFNIFLDVEETSILTREELYQIMLHEIAHVVNQDTKRSWRLERFFKSYDSELAFVGKYVLGILYIHYFMEKTAYTVACTRFYEQNADKAVCEYGNGQVYINGTAKSMLLSMYQIEYNPKINFELFESEKIPEDYLYLDMKVFAEMKEVYSAKWNYVMSHRIPSRMDSHPTLLMRMEHMGVSSYDCAVVETDESYIAEQQKLLKLGNDNIIKNTQKSYDERRKSFYLPLKAKLEQYKSLEESGATLSLVQLTDYMEVLYHADRDKCLKIANDILVKTPRSGYANFYKGLILAERLDPECVECLYAAVRENSNFADTALDTIGMFACNTGNQELLDKYRERIKSDFIDVSQRKDELSLHNDDVYAANNLDDEDFNAILDYIVEKGKDVIESIYSVSRGEGERALNVYYIEFYKGSKVEDCDKVYDDVFLLLDTYEEGKERDYNFNLYTSIGVNKNPKANAFRATHGSLIYSAKDGKLPRK